MPMCVRSREGKNHSARKTRHSVSHQSYLWDTSNTVEEQLVLVHVPNINNTRCYCHRWGPISQNIIDFWRNNIIYLWESKVNAKKWSAQLRVEEGLAVDSNRCKLVMYVTGFMFNLPFVPSSLAYLVMMCTITGSAGIGASDARGPVSFNRATVSVELGTLNAIESWVPIKSALEPTPILWSQLPLDTTRETEPGQIDSMKAKVFGDQPLPSGATLLLREAMSVSSWTSYEQTHNRQSFLLTCHL